MRYAALNIILAGLLLSSMAADKWLNYMEAEAREPAYTAAQIRAVDGLIDRVERKPAVKFRKERPMTKAQMDEAFAGLFDEKRP